MSIILNITMLIDELRRITVLTLRYLLYILKKIQKNARNVLPVLHQKGLREQNKIQRLSTLEVRTKAIHDLQTV